MHQYSSGTWQIYALVPMYGTTDHQHDTPALGPKSWSYLSAASEDRNERRGTCGRHLFLWYTVGFSQSLGAGKGCIGAITTSDLGDVWQALVGISCRNRFTTLSFGSTRCFACLHPVSGTNCHTSHHDEAIKAPGDSG